MAMPRPTDVDDYFDRLQPVARPHLEKLREMSRAAAPTAREELQWNQPAYLLDQRLWMLQAFTRYAWLRFPLRSVGAHKADITGTGYDSGTGMITLPFDQELPVDILNLLMKARLDEYEATGAGWST